MKISLFAKLDKPYLKEIITFLKSSNAQLSIYTGSINDGFPKKAYKENPDILISFLSPWIIPKSVLVRTRIANINFHPGPPEYPGIGCFNFAIYNDEKRYGVTAHIMKEKVDTGAIIGIKMFPLLKNDSVYSLSLKSYKHLRDLFYKTIGFILKNNSLPNTITSWKRKPFLRKELEDLCLINYKMSKKEIEKRIRATVYPNMPGAYIKLAGYKFEYAQNR